MIILAVVLPAYILATWIWVKTGYTIDQGELIVHCGPMRWRIKLSDITHLTETRQMLAWAGPALSMDRIIVRYDRFGKIAISPLDKERFFALMEEKCPQAEIVREQ